jgi:hypothetical protein
LLPYLKSGIVGLALRDDRLTDGLRQMAFAGSSRAKKQGVFPFVDECAGGQIEDQTAIGAGGPRGRITA